MKSGEKRADDQNLVRFEQIVPPHNHIEFSVDPFNLLLSRPGMHLAVNSGHVIIYMLT